MNGSIQRAARLSALTQLACAGVILLGVHGGRAAAQSSGAQQILNDIGSVGSGETGADLQISFATIANDPGLQRLVAFALENYGDSLSAYQRSLLQTLQNVGANAELLTPGAPQSQPERYQQFQSWLLSQPAVRALAGDGARAKADPAALQARINTLRDEISSMTSQPPPTPEQSCGSGAQSSLVGASVSANDSGATSEVSGAILRHIDDPAFGEVIQSANDVTAAVIQPVSGLVDLPLIDANGDPIPVFSFGKFLKGVVEVAGAVVAGAAVIVSGGTAAVIALGVAGAVLAAAPGVADIVDAVNTPSTGDCPGTAPACGTSSPCGVGACSFNCCVAVGSTSSALVAANLVACSVDSDCSFGELCTDGCCQVIPPS